MVKAIIFDLGGVLVRTPDRTSRREWERRLGLKEWESEAIVFGSEMGQMAQLGNITNEELWVWVGKRLKLEAEQLPKFRRSFWAGDMLDRELVRLIRGLRPRYQTAILSNAADNLRVALHENFGIADAFDLIVCSAEEGVMKPDHEIYARTLARLGRSPEESVFIDDTEANVKAAREIDIHAIHFSPTIDLAEELAGLGIDLETNDENE